MNFKELLKLTEESRSTADSFRTTGEAMRKDKATGGAADSKAKDAARKRAERAKKLPRERMSKDQLIREVIAVQTNSGRIQIIFKDSFNKKYHTKINRGEALSYEEAKTLTQDPKFEQTGASKLLFGNIREKETKEKTGGKGPEDKGEAQDQTGPEIPSEKPEKRAKRLSSEEIFNLMTQMPAEQLAQMPFEVRQQFFKQIRNPPSSIDFDNASFEDLTVKFGINLLTNTPFNQQVMNALVFLAKLKAGASDQELETYGALSPNAFDFTKNAYLQAKKILSQIGEECIQNLVSTIENGTKTSFVEGNVDMECGAYKFKMSVGGEVSLTTDKFDQTSKNFRGIIANAINQAMANPMSSKDPKVAEFMQSVNSNGVKYSQQLISQKSFADIKNDPDLIVQLQQTPLVDSSGQQRGMIVDKDGNLNPLASLDNYQEDIAKAAPSLFMNSKNKPSEFVNNFVNSVLKVFYRGDNIKDPATAPTHLITQNGVFPMSDEYFDEISRTATVSIKPTKTILDNKNIETSTKGKPSETLSRFMTVIEAKEEKAPKKPSLDQLFVPKENIDPLQFALSYIGQNMDFDINASLLPGFSPKDLNTVQYNYVRIGKKTIKIPVQRNEKIINDVVNESAIIVNDLLIESLSNNFLLSTLLSSRLLSQDEASILTDSSLLVENVDLAKNIYNIVLERANAYPEVLAAVLNKYNEYLYEKYVRDYKMEYRNYHGKPKQKKQRAARTRAREEMKKKGRAKVGDGKDIDHKKPLRSGGSNGINNLRSRNKSENRSDNGHHKGEKQNKDWK
jgi:5-methylcytosine-specific restriction endonuclease McrA